MRGVTAGDGGVVHPASAKATFASSAAWASVGVSPM